MTYTEFEEYFKQFAIEPEYGIKSVFFVTDWSEILDFQAKKSQYPALVVELHDVADNYGGVSADLSIAGAITVIKGMRENRPHSEYRAAKKLTLKILHKVIQKLVCDGDAVGLFEFELTGNSDPISKVTADNAYGWRRGFHIGGITIDTDDIIPTT